MAKATVSVHRPDPLIEGGGPGNLVGTYGGEYH